MEEKECPIHGLTPHPRYGDRLRCRKCETQRTREYRQARKRHAIEYLGGKCQLCGYDKCIGALEFHHKDPTQKEFQLSKYLKNRNEVLHKELDKCMLLCANCHREIHYLE